MVVKVTGRIGPVGHGNRGEGKIVEFYVKIKEGIFQTPGKILIKLDERATEDLRKHMRKDSHVGVGMDLNGREIKIQIL